MEKGAFGLSSTTVTNFTFIWFYGISIIGYLKPNPVYRYILDIFDLYT